MLKGNVFNIQRFSLHDGPGIRDTVFLKGCSLKCWWCHNPESHDFKNNLMFDTAKCLNCNACVNECDNNAHQIIDGVHKILRDKCVACGKCAKVCPTKALEYCGKIYSTDEVIKEVIKDMDFFKSSKGGVTISGGEPLCQMNFTLELAKKLKKIAVNVAIETSGYAKTDKILELSKYVDYFLYDIKLFDEQEHIKYTGVSNKVILQNLKALYESGAKIVLRCPIIPNVNYNEKHFERLKELIVSMPKLEAVNLEAYHPLGVTKSKKLHLNCLYNNETHLDKQELIQYAKKLSTKEVPVSVL